MAPEGRRRVQPFGVDAPDVVWAHNESVQLEMIDLSGFPQEAGGET